MKKRRIVSGSAWRFLLLAILMIIFPALPARAEDAVTIQFLDASGQSCGISDIRIEPGEKVKLPKAPADPDAPSGDIHGLPCWKPVPGFGAALMKSGSTLTCSEAAELAAENGDGSVLKLYGTRVLALTYYNNKGTSVYWKRYYYEGTATNLNNSPSASNQAYKGWSRYRGGSGVWGKFGARITMTDNLNVYLVVYPRLRYLNKTGSQVLHSGYYRRGTSVILLSVPAMTNYRILGWARTKNASSAVFQSGDTLTLNENTDLYAAYRYLPYTVKFTSNDGTSSDKVFTSLYQRAASGDYIRLPAVPAVKNYIALGWSAKKKDTSASLKEGASVKVTGNITYYAVYRKAKSCQITFVDTDGSTSSKFSSLNKKVEEGTTITLPAVPSRSGYIAKGWKIKINDKVQTYETGTKIRVAGTYKFYAVYAESISVTLHYNDGQTYRTAQVSKGSKYGLPCMENPAGYTFMGWSRTKGMTISPTRPAASYYEAGNQVTVNGSLHLYAVLMKRSEEGSVVNGQLYGSGSPDTSAYKGIIFVGDSRTDRLKKTLLNQIGKTGIQKKNVDFVYKSGQGLAWFQSTGYNSLLQLLDRQDASDTRPVAVIFNLGVNDLGSYSGYISYLKEIAPVLKGRNCELFYMSVNPINSAMIHKVGFADRKEWEVRKFNTNIREGLAGIFTYIDIYSWLMQTGYSTNQGESGYDNGKDDGLHYSVNTYKRIYLRCLQFLSGGL